MLDPQTAHFWIPLAPPPATPSPFTRFGHTGLLDYQMWQALACLWAFAWTTCLECYSPCSSRGLFLCFKSQFICYVFRVPSLAIPSEIAVPTITSPISSEPSGKLSSPCFPCGYMVTGQQGSSMRSRDCARLGLCHSPSRGARRPSIQVQQREHGTHKSTYRFLSWDT